MLQGYHKSEGRIKKSACLKNLWLCCIWASSCKEAPPPSHSGTLHCSLCCALTLMGRAVTGGVARCLSGSTLSSSELYTSCLQLISRVQRALELGGCIPNALYMPRRSEWLVS